MEEYDRGPRPISGMSTAPLPKPMISVVIPALNEEASIGRTINAIPVGALNELGYEVETVVVDNGSEDMTSQEARKNGARVIWEPRRGYGRAYKTGFANARGDIIVTADADATYPVEMIPSLVILVMNEKLDFLTTDRFAGIGKAAMSFQHRLGNSALSLLARFLFRIDLKDSQSGMWAFKRNLLLGLDLRSDGMAFSQELKIEACHGKGRRWREVPITYRARLDKPRLRTWNDGLRNLLHLFSKRVTLLDWPIGQRALRDTPQETLGLERELTSVSED